MYRHVLLDMDDTVFDFQRAERSCIFAAAAQFGLELSEAQYAQYSEINRLQWEKFERRETTTERLRVERFEQFFDRQGIESVAPAEFSEAYLEHLAGDTTLIDGAADMCRALCRRGKTITIVTNGIYKNQYSRVENSDIAPYVKFMVASEEVGAAKPESAIFKEALRRCGCGDPKDAVMVGDLLYADIYGAQKCGIDGVWCNFRGRVNDTGITPAYTAVSFRELLDIIK